MGQYQHIVTARRRNDCGLFRGRLTANSAESTALAMTGPKWDDRFLSSRLSDRDAADTRIGERGPTGRRRQHPRRHAPHRCVSGASVPPLLGDIRLHLAAEWLVGNMTSLPDRCEP